MTVTYSYAEIAEAIANLDIQVLQPTGLYSALSIKNFGDTNDIVQDRDCPLLEPQVTNYVTGSEDEDASVGGSGAAFYITTYTLNYWYHHCGVDVWRQSTAAVRNQCLANSAIIYAAITAVDTSVIVTKEVRIKPVIQCVPAVIENGGDPAHNTYGFPVAFNIMEWQNAN